MSTITNNIQTLLFYTKEIFGMGGIKVPMEMDIDENDVNIALDLIHSGNLGKGNHYNNELTMAMYFEEVKGMSSSKSVSEMLGAYANFLVIDGITKYVLSCARKNGDLDKEIALMYGRKLRALNEHIRKYGPMNNLEECIDGYMEICFMIFAMLRMDILLGF